MKTVAKLRTLAKDAQKFKVPDSVINKITNDANFGVTDWILSHLVSLEYNRQSVIKSLKNEGFNIYYNDVLKQTMITIRNIENDVLVSKLGFENNKLCVLDKFINRCIDAGYDIIVLK